MASGSVGRAVIGRLSQASYLAWPSRRRWSNQNYGHVLGLPPDHPNPGRCGDDKIDHNVGDRYDPEATDSALAETVAAFRSVR